MFFYNAFDTAYERPSYFRNCFSFFRTPKSDQFLDAILLTLILYLYFLKCLVLFIYPASSIKLNKCNSIKVIIIKCTIKVNDIKVFINRPITSLEDNTLLGLQLKNAISSGLSLSMSVSSLKNTVLLRFLTILGVKNQSRINFNAVTLPKIT